MNEIPQVRHRYKIHDKLYDLTHFVKIHPGGEDMFDHLKSDTNITPMVYAYHKNPKNILAMLPDYEATSNIDSIKIDYDTNYKYDTYCELKKLVYDEMHEKKIPLYWSNKELAYNTFMFLMYVGVWGHCFWNAKHLSSWWMVLMGVFTMSLGTLIFHETSHYTGFKKQKYNLLYSQYYPFTNMNYWKQKHNYLHHSFTDMEYDWDLMAHKLNFNYFRYSNIVSLQFHHKFQFIYVWVIWMTAGIHDKKHNYFSLQNSNKCVVLFMLYYFGLYKVLLFYSVFGFNFLFVANLSHIHHECIDINREKKNDFLYNQVSSAMNYRTPDPITRFVCFGLDIQIEHHLFPNIPHSSLRQIKHVVRAYCEKNNIPYIEQPSIFPTIYSYASYLYKMGNP